MQIGGVKGGAGEPRIVPSHMALQAQQRRCILNPKFATLHAHQRIKSRKLALAHRQHRHSLVLPWEDHEHRDRR